MGAIYLVRPFPRDNLCSTAGQRSWLQPCSVLAVALPGFLLAATLMLTDGFGC